MGVPPEWLKDGAYPEVVDELDDEFRYEVFEENWAAVSTFLRLTTQFNVLASPGGKALLLGLDYQAVELLMNYEEVEDRADTFARIQVMEGEAIKIVNSKR